MRLDKSRGRAATAIGVAVLAAAATAGALATGGTAAPSAVPAPNNTTTPTISGTPQEGQRLTSTRGAWEGSPTDYNYFWTRCDKTGNSCADIGGATAAAYTLTSADVGNTVRFKVQARNAGGSTFASSVPTAVVTAATPAATTTAPTTPATGCPRGTGPAAVADVKAPARLVIDQQQVDPLPVPRSPSQIILRYHVSNTCGQAVQGALVYATAIPFGQLTVPAEATTDGSGWAEVVIRPIAGGFPLNGRQQSITMFVRARKAGEDLLAGISSRRLFSVPVRQR